MIVPRRCWCLLLCAACVTCAAMLLASAWLALAPIRAATRDEPFDIPRGTWARRMAGDKVTILPAEVRLTLGVHDVLLLRNLDDVPQMFGPVLIMPGQRFRLPFEQAGDYQFACTAHASGQMRVLVAPMPATGWARLDWHIQARWRVLGAIFNQRSFL